MSNIDFKALSAPFKDNEIEWRVGTTSTKGETKSGLALPYVDNRAIMDRLDEVCGAANWKNEYKPGASGGVLCGISIRIDGEWIAKWDGADNSQVEPVKGGLSDAMKRAAVQWGIGRYLYDADDVWVELQQFGNSWGIPRNVKAGLKVKVNGQPVNAPTPPQRTPPAATTTAQTATTQHQGGEQSTPPATTTPPPAKVERPYAADVLIENLKVMATKSRAPLWANKDVQDKAVRDYAIFTQNFISTDLRHWVQGKAWGKESANEMTPQEIDAMTLWLKGNHEFVEKEASALRRMMTAEKEAPAQPDSDAAFAGITGG